MCKQIEHFEILVNRAGGQSALAEILTAIMHKKITQSHVRNWLCRNKRVPPQYVIPLCKYFDWEIEPNDLRPDVFPRGVKIEE